MSSSKNITNETKSTQLTSHHHYDLNYATIIESFSSDDIYSTFYESQNDQKAISPPFSKKIYDKFTSNPTRKSNNEDYYKQIELESYIYYHFFLSKSLTSSTSIHNNCNKF
jgi:hypothetical protein